MGDVLGAVYDSLRQNVSSQEFHSHPDSERVTTAYQSRYRRFKGTRRYEEEKGKGVKRVDFLLEKTRWVGLSSTKEGPNVWMLNTCPW